MAVVVPPVPAALPTPPSTDDPTNFDTRADAFNAAMPAFQEGMQDLADNAFANATDAAANADVALAAATASENSAIASAASSGAVMWVSGTTYAVNDVRASPARGDVYRRLTIGAGTVDPYYDSTNWVPVIQMSAGVSLFLAMNFGAT